MSAKTSITVQNIEEKSRKLRQELKDWERSFAAANGGRKAAKEDIKQEPSIGRLMLDICLSVREAGC